MTDRSESFDLNRASWDERVPAHAESPDYALDRFAGDPAFLSGVVRFDLPRLGDVAGLDVVHLQCHIGTDTVSLARLGARVTGLDFSAAAVEQARGFAAGLGLDVPFVQADVYDAVDALGGNRFDLVFTGIGALCWLPDIDRWAGVVAGLLRPGGRLFLREGHPMLWSIDETRPDGLLVVEHPYFERDEPVVWDEGGTYVQTDRTFTRNVTHEWNHGLGEIVTALHRHGLALTMLVEHYSAPWDTVPGRTTVDDLGEFRLTDRRWRLPMTYTLQATKA
ncbi:bifunctional 2-polyprenyl-6-hydroxyphenol methylase/3-demethylubiquinol 3-O-methyltransferase UbiG [Kineosporia sp. R_H_3]|uniref:class I SAM-dependent methyltransferase n=1 Tax=Kineosporia sp. R_H_3 TaxID=1961848 RepID=UPI000B4BFFD8|nr:class I SAM-dependent methyltransferase [Kineosporia sp. R_H_3]